jgi:hypothetical protein
VHAPIMAAPPQRRGGRVLPVRRRALQALAAAALAAGLAGCGHTAGPSASAPPPTPTSASDVAACNELQTSIRIISALVTRGVETMTRSLHPKQLARRTGAMRENLLYAASVLERIDPPRSLGPAWRELVAGLREFAADFGRAQKSVARNHMASAARQLADRKAVAELTEATNAIDEACGT